MNCEHENFRADVDIVRITDAGRFMADVRVECESCAERFVFLGMDCGLMPDTPTTSIDGLVAHLPLRPENGKPGGVMAGFTVARKQ